MIALSSIKTNPNNPRVIRDGKFKKLVESLRAFPEMMTKRPMVCVTDVDKKLFPLGGNMRLLAIQELGYKEIPDSWVMLADEWTEEQRKEFTIKDNVGFGEWDWDNLANNWDEEKLEEWGLDLPKFDNKDEDDPPGYAEMPAWFLNIRCNDEEECQKLYERFIAEGFDVKIIT